MDQQDITGYVLRERLKRKHVDEEPVKKKDYYIDIRKKLKSDPERYVEHKRMDALNHRLQRLRMNETQRKIYNEKCKIRMREYRIRKNENGEQSTQPMTRKQVEKKRTYWREKKRQQRSQMTDEKRREEANKRKQHYQSSKKKLQFTPTKESVRKASERMNIPKDPSMFAEAINKVIDMATPRKKEALKVKGVLFSPKSKETQNTNAKIVASVKLALKDMKRNQTKRGKQLYYWLVQSLVGKHMVEKRIRTSLDSKLQYMKRMSLLSDEPILKYDSISSETKENIKTFFKTEAVIIPNKRSVLKDGRQRSIMTDSLKQAHKRFQGGKISLSTFKRNRPKEVLTMDKEKFRTCLCEYCLNVQFKIESLNKMCNDQNQKEIKLEDKYDCVQRTLCETPKKECYERKCNECGATKIREHFENLIQLVGNQDIRWKRWEIGTVKQVRRQVLNEKLGKMNSIITELTLELQKLPKHIFVANWQRQQFQKITKRVPTNWVVSVADFAENYRCLNQDEIQSAYYNYHQATVFPLIAHYNCPKCEDGIVQDSAVFISSDLIHDADAVKQFTKQMDSHIRDEVDFSHEVQFSDGCAAQFKSNKPFQNLSEVKTHTFERAFFGSRHGKNACDALGGLVKNQAERFVRSRKETIQTAKDLYNFCHSNLSDPEQSDDCKHRKRTFFYVEHINRDNGQNDLKTVKGTQSFHNVRGVTEGVVKVRNLSCFCPACIGTDKSGECENLQFVEEWAVHSMKGKAIQNEKANIIQKRGKKATMGEDRVKKVKEQKKATGGKGVKCEEIHDDEVDMITKKGEKKATVGERDTYEPQNKGTVKKVTAKGKKKATECKKVTDEVSNDDEVDMITKKGGKKATVGEGDKCKEQDEDSLMRECSTFNDLKEFVENLEIGDLQRVTAKTFFDTWSVVDNISLPLVPEDIPMQPSCQLYPCTIYGDGNCLPRAGSVLVYGIEDNHKEIRKRIVMELTRNEEKYLDNIYMNKGKHENAQENVPQAFAQYSSFYTWQRLTKRTIKNLYEKEVLEIRKSGSWMGLWQVASLANILNCPVVSVCPTYGTNTVRNDMHRIFYPFSEDFHGNKPVFLMWISLSGVKQEEKEFALNHFDVLMTLIDTDSDDSIVPEFSDNIVDNSFDLCNSANSSILDIITNLMSGNKEELYNPEIPVLSCPELPVLSDPEMTESRSVNVKADPETTDETDPNTIIEANPEIPVLSCPEFPVLSDIETIESRSVNVKADPETTDETNPNTMIEANPEIPVLSDPETTESTSVTVMADPETTVKADPYSFVLADPETVVQADPETPEHADTETTVHGDPETTVEADSETTVLVEMHTQKSRLTAMQADSEIHMLADLATTDKTEPKTMMETDPETMMETDPETTYEINPDNTVEADPETTDRADRETMIEVDTETIHEADPDTTDEIYPDNTVEADQKTTIETCTETTDESDRETIITADPEATFEINSD